MNAKEKRRLKKLLQYEQQAHLGGHELIGGCDEAGRGPLAGPVVAAVCLLPASLLQGIDLELLEGVNDSKQLPEEVRQELFSKITNHPEIIFSTGVIEAPVIDEINILKATFEAMLAAFRGLSKMPDHLLVDGPFAPNFGISTQPIIDGDALSLSIACASIIAKETRDSLMRHYHTLWPQYGFHRHKGYATEEHLRALEKHGPCAIHRRTFNSVKEVSQC